MKRHELTVRVEPKDAAKLRRAAKRDGRSLNSFMRVAGLERADRKQIEKREGGQTL